MACSSASSMPAVSRSSRIAASRWVWWGARPSPLRWATQRARVSAGACRHRKGRWRRAGEHIFLPPSDVASSPNHPRAACVAAPPQRPREHLQAAQTPDGRACLSRAIRVVRSGAGISHQLGLSILPLQMDSQAKYRALARGEGGILLRLPIPGSAYREKICVRPISFFSSFFCLFAVLDHMLCTERPDATPVYILVDQDHADGPLLVTEAGGKISDRRGMPLAHAGREFRGCCHAREHSPKGH